MPPWYRKNPCNGLTIGLGWIHFNNQSIKSGLERRAVMKNGRTAQAVEAMGGPSGGGHERPRA
jgi:hypothetical protein